MGITITQAKENSELTNEFIKENKGLVIKVLSKKFYLYYGSSEFEDLEQIGYIGLFKAIKKYDITKGIEFSTFAYKYIYGSISNYIRDNKNKLNVINFDDVQINAEDCSIEDVLPIKYNLENDFLNTNELKSNLNIVKNNMSEKHCATLTLLLEGYNKKEIAKILDISQPTVDKICKQALVALDQAHLFNTGDLKASKHKIRTIVKAKCEGREIQTLPYNSCVNQVYNWAINNIGCNITMKALKGHAYNEPFSNIKADAIHKLMANGYDVKQSGASFKVIGCVEFDEDEVAVTKTEQEVKITISIKGAM